VDHNASKKGQDVGWLVGEGGDIRGKWPKPLDDQQSGKFGYLITAPGVKNTMYSCKTRDGEARRGQSKKG